MSMKILLADPDFETLKEEDLFFRNLFYEPVQVNCGKNAQLALYKTKFLAMVLNLDLQEHSGAEVFRYAKANFPALKIILTMKNEESLNLAGLQKKILEKQGVTDIFFFPLDLKLIKKAIEGHYKVPLLFENDPTREGASTEVSVEAEDNKFTSIKVDEFISGKTVQFDIFIRLGSGHYIKILHAGDSFSKERIDKYKYEKQIENLYLLVEDRSKYLRFENYLGQKMANNTQISANTKVSILNHVSEKIIEEVYFEGIKPQVLEESKIFCHSMYKTIQNNPSLNELLKTYLDFDASAYSHNFLVCLFSSLMARQFEWNSEFTIETLGMAAILHDIGNINLPHGISQRTVNQMNEVELALYQQHPLLALEILNSNSSINSAVKQIILQHHECSDGSGFPNKLAGNKILPMAKIIFLADDFTNIMVEGKLTPVQAIKTILSKPNSAKKYGFKFLESFIKAFKEPIKNEDMPISDESENKKIS